MAEQSYDYGDLARLSAVFKVNGVETDPTTVTITVRAPDGTTTTDAYNPGGITRDGVGLYHLDLTTDQNGEWSYKFTGTGAAADVGPGIFYVRPDPTADTPYLYVSLDQIKETMTLAGQTNLDPLISRTLETISRALDQIADRIFHPIGSLAVPATRYFTAGLHHRHHLFIGDTQSISSLTVDIDGDGIHETTWVEGTDFYLDPSDAAERSEPYDTLSIRWRSGRRFPIYQRAIKVEGVFGWAKTPPGVQSFAEILAKRIISRSRDDSGNQALGLVLSGNDLGSITRIARTDPDFDLLFGPYCNLRQMVA